MRKHAIILMLLGLAACATPAQQCRTDATRDLRVVDDLITETRINISRGYALRRDVEPTVHVHFCTGRRDGWLFCNHSGTRVVERPVAIDLEEERRKLDSLLLQRERLQSRARRGLAACDARFGTG